MNSGTVVRTLKCAKIMVSALWGIILIGSLYVIILRAEKSSHGPRNELVKKCVWLLDQIHLQ